MNYLLLLAEIISGLTVIIGVLSAFFIWIKRLVEGQKCQLRSDMLSIYYKHKNKKTIRQYEYENFMLMFKAYKALKGNSFIDEIYNVVTHWEIVS